MSHFPKDLEDHTSQNIQATQIVFKKRKEKEQCLKGLDEERDLGGGGNE